MKENSKAWLKEGRQSKITRIVRELATNFSGNDFEKIRDILKWMDKNIKRRRDREVLKIFATRTAAKVLKDGFSTGCHDDALLFATLCRAVGIPAKYIVGINKLDPRNRGHCVVEAYVDKSWVLIDQSSRLICLDPKRSDFYKENFVVGKGSDSWEVGIRSSRSWKERANKIAEVVSKIKI